MKNLGCTLNFTIRLVISPPAMDLHRLDLYHTSHTKTKKGVSLRLFLYLHYNLESVSKLNSEVCMCSTSDRIDL